MGNIAKNRARSVAKLWLPIVTLTRLSFRRLYTWFARVADGKGKEKTFKIEKNIVDNKNQNQLSKHVFINIYKNKRYTYVQNVVKRTEIFKIGSKNYFWQMFSTKQLHVCLLGHYSTKNRQFST